MDAIVYDKVGKEAAKVRDALYGIYPQETITDAAIAPFDDGADGIPVQKLVANIEPVQAGSGDPSPDNVRPISGWTGANVTRTGKNLFDVNKVAKINSVGSNRRNGIYITKPGTYAVKANTNYPGVNISSRLKSADGVYGTPTVIADGTYTYTANYTVTDGDTLIVFDAVDNDLATSKQNFSNLNIQIERSSTATDYEPYTGSQISITFPSEAGTVYSGTLDVTNGVLTVDRAVKNLNGSENWIVNSAAQNLYYTGSDTFIDIKIDSVIISDTFSATSAPAASMVNGQMKIAGRNINFKTSFETLNDWKAELQRKNVQVVYEVITPITYQLTTEQVSGILTTLYGTNNIWADTGNIKKLTYRADLGKYIDSHITTAVANALNA